MASGDTNVGICNKALILLGSDTITSFSDGSAAGTACNTIYDEVKLSTMGMYPWSFTVKKAELSKESATPASEWSYQFTLPSDMLNGVPRAVRTSGSAGAGLYKNWEIGQSAAGTTVLFAESTTIHIDYQKAVAEGTMPTYFVTLLTYQMAWHLAQIITEQMNKAEFWRTTSLGTPAEGLRGGYFRQAVSMDAAGQTPSVISDYLLTDIR
tara:strand:+ start:5466 stop:6095 length:630 start_codon:yes stop_codon:yes gene_type:complete